jgi:Carbohydrate family 9 binding domain-like
MTFMFGSMVRRGWVACSVSVALVQASACGVAVESSVEAEALTKTPTLQAFFTTTTPEIDGVIDAVWQTAPSVRFNKNTKGEATGPITEVRAMWTKDALYMVWALQGAGFNVDTTRDVNVERKELYNEDCVELFLTPDPKNHPERYYEIELGSFGHFYDLGLTRTQPGKRTEDEAWSSGLTISTRRDMAKHTAVIEAKFTAPEIVNGLRAGATLPLGLFRIEGKNPTKYLAWSPALTPKPDFHVASAFGGLALKGTPIPPNAP